MSHQLLEVMALGVPIVTTTAGGNVEVIQNGENGVLVQYDDADLMTSEVLKMLSDSIWSGKLVSQGLKSIHNFSEEKMLSSLAKELS
jgi:glycosyltransferase involved in cell wall biosynthesis